MRNVKKEGEVVQVENKEKKKQTKLSLFIENFFVYGVGGVINKVIPLIMVPIVTRLMPDSSYYGISDLSNTVLSFGSALAVMGMYDAMYRMFFEKDEENYKKEICSTTMSVTIVTSIVVFLIMILCKDIIAMYVFGDNKYGYLVYITAMATLIGGTNSIISAPTRMQNKRKVYLVMNTLSPLLSYSVSIPLLLTGHYIIALPLAALIAAATQELIFWVLNKEWFKFKKIRTEYIKPLLKIALPLLPNFIIYWIFNSSDRLMIANLIGTGSSGIYAVGAKLGHASQLIYTAFAGGWQYFAFATMKEKDQVKTNSMIFEYLGVISFVCSMFVFALSESIYKLLFTGDYVAGYIVAPYLFLAPLLQMLFQVACNQFLVVRKTWPNLFILSSGAVLNIILNLYLIPKIGIEGAAIATLIGYVVSDLIGVIVLSKMKLHIISVRFTFCCILMAAFIIIWRTLILHNVLLSLGLAVVFCVVIGWLYSGDIELLLSKAKGMVKK